MLISNIELPQKISHYKSPNENPQFLYFSLYFLGFFDTGVVLVRLNSDQKRLNSDQKKLNSDQKRLISDEKRLYD
jgi:hypothetical protein